MSALAILPSPLAPPGLPSSGDQAYILAMSILKIARMGHPVLRQLAQPVETITRDDLRLIDDMLETMLDAEGIGLAAPQVHVARRIIVFLDLARQDEAPDARPMVLVNPEFAAIGPDMVSGLEGCLSMPGLRGVVPRHTRIRYRGLDPRGREIEREVEGLAARVVQHEVDHLDGVLYPERMASLHDLVFDSELRHLVAQVEAEARAEREGHA
jgi:peptide deformylase